MSTLAVSNLVGGYGAVQILHGISFNVEPGEIVVILGANGAGKTTTLKALSGLVKTQGDVVFDGKDLGRLAPSARAKLGMAHVPEGRGTLADLSVLDNLKVGGYLLPKQQVEGALDRWFDVFPRLAERRTQLAGSLSGGEQQMLAIARALTSGPKLLLLDEPSMGLAPKITGELFVELARINEVTGTAMLIVEQNAQLALGIADRGYVLEVGELVTEGRADDLAANDDVRRAYLGI